jgi:hypothetical protein
MENPNPQPENPEKRKISFGSFRPPQNEEPHQDRLHQIISYAKENTRDTVGYVLLIIGILLMFFNTTSMIGSLIVGIIFSLYFINELSFLCRNSTALTEEHGLVKAVVFGGTLLALFFRAPFLFIGMAIIIAIKLLLFPTKDET